jgi:hypothetical protein
MHPPLAELLRKRLEIIADHSWRDRDPGSQLAALQEVSEKINEWAAAHRSSIDGRLRHYLDNASYQKALEHLESGLA